MGGKDKDAYVLVPLNQCTNKSTKGAKYARPEQSFKYAYKYMGPSGPLSILAQIYIKSRKLNQI